LSGYDFWQVTLSSILLATAQRLIASALLSKECKTYGIEKKHQKARQKANTWPGKITDKGSFKTLPWAFCKAY
jgi:hypothetical protein